MFFLSAICTILTYLSIFAFSIVSIIAFLMTSDWAIFILHLYCITVIKYCIFAFILHKNDNKMI